VLLTLALAECKLVEIYQVHMRCN